MKNKYPCYRVKRNAWSECEIFDFEDSRAGLEAAIEFAKENNCHFVACLTRANAKPEIVWSTGMKKATDENEVIILRGVNGAPITSYKQ